MSKSNSGSRGSFSGRIGYVMAVAGSAVGLGNIWRFPYLAAKYGGGIFLFVYLVLMLTFGFTMIVSETALGRKTGKSPVGAFGLFGKTLPFKFGGWINAIIPILIAPYYCVIGGWVVKYLVEYLSGNAAQLATDTYFIEFIGSATSTELWFLVFSLLTVLVIFGGVKNGIERVSKIMMPILVVLAIIIAVYSMTRPGALEGVKYFLVPNFSHFSWKTVVAAMGQMFYSLSIAMGILYTYGSYLGKDVDIEKTTRQVELFDTGIAVLAGLMIIPAVFAFSGGNPDTLNAGPSLMFITLPKVFASMGLATPAGILFFVLVLFAALTSSISLVETGVSTFADEFGWDRKKGTVIMALIIVVLGSASALGFNVLSFVTVIGMGILDFFDFLTNSLMMPISAMATCVLISRVVGVGAVAQEVELSSGFRSKKLYTVVIRYFAPICLAIILLTSIGSLVGWIDPL